MFTCLLLQCSSQKVKNKFLPWRRTARSYAIKLGQTLPVLTNFDFLKIIYIYIYIYICACTCMCMYGNEQSKACMRLQASHAYMYVKLATYMYVLTSRNNHLPFFTNVWRSRDLNPGPQGWEQWRYHSKGLWEYISKSIPSVWNHDLQTNSWTSFLS